MKVDTKVISPELARDMLKRNINNRPLNKNHVDFLSKQMTEGKWMFDGTPIKLTEAGSLLDGQHRLTAVIESGLSFDFLVISGVNKDSFKVMDTGRNRKASDVLSINGIQQSQDAQIVCRDVLNYRKSGMLIPHFNNGKITNSDILEFAEENEQRLMESIKFVGKFKKPIIAKSKLASFHFLFSEKNVIEAGLFISKLCTGLDISADSSIYVLREKLISDSISKQKINPRRKHAFIIKCWNLFRQGQSVTSRLNIPSEDKIQIL